MSDNRGVRIHRFGGPEVLELEDLPVPEPREAHRTLEQEHPRGKVVLEV